MGIQNLDLCFLIAYVQAKKEISLSVSDKGSYGLRQARKEGGGVLHIFYAFKGKKIKKEKKARNLQQNLTKKRVL